MTSCQLAQLVGQWTGVLRVMGLRPPPGNIIVHRLLVSSGKFWLFFYICIYCIYLKIINIFKKNNKKDNNNVFNSKLYSIAKQIGELLQHVHYLHDAFIKQCHLSSDVLCLTSKCVCKFIYTTHLVFLN